MFKILEKKHFKFGLPAIFAITLIGSNFKFNFYISLILLIMAIYYFFVFSKKDIFNPMGLFSAVWIGGIFLASLQLTHDQQNWSFYTWLNLSLIYLGFLTSYKIINLKLKQKDINIKFNKERFYKTIVIILLISYVSFFVEAYNLKFIPIFSKNMSAYLDFHYLFLHYFTLLIALVPALTIIYKSMGGMKKILIINIFSVLMPIMLVSRQTILFQTILVVVAYHYCIREIKIQYLIFLAFIGLILFSLASNLRHQNVDYMYSVANFKSDKQTILAQPYLYISMNFENLRNAIENSKEFYYGIYTLSPFIELFNLNNFFNYSAPSFLINPYFNTSTFALPFYTDFGILGMFVGGLLTGGLSSLTYYLFNKSKGINNIIYGVITYCIIFTFFVNFFINLNIIFDLFILGIVFILNIDNCKSFLKNKLGGVIK